MDYNSIHGPGVSNFSSSSPHRMPTVSAAQALQDLKSSPTRCISTGLSLLDCAVQNRELTASDDEPVHSGVSRGKVTEVYGPPGVGKTALGMQLAAGVLYAGEGVIWVDASHPIPGARLSHILSSYQPLHPSSSPKETRSISELAEKLTQFSTPTLAHLIALLANPTANHPPPNTALIVIDSFSTLISNAFPKSADANSKPRKPGLPNPSARKVPILQYVINTLQKLAATRNIAIVIFSQCMTKMRPGLGAALVPAISTTAWEQGLGCRIALFRDWGWDDEDGRSVDHVRLAQVIKAEGIAVPGGRARLVGFSICETGLVPLALPTRPTQFFGDPSPVKASHPLNNNSSPQKQGTPASNNLPQKRKLSAANVELEIPDSDAEDDEDYGWGEDDEEELPPPPPQWQGSEDILIPDPAERELVGETEVGAGGEVEVEDDDEVVVGEMATEQIERVIEDSEDELA